MSVSVSPVEQRRQALGRAHEVRSARAEVKAGLREGTITLVSALERDCCKTATVYVLLIAQKGWGAVRVAKVLNRLRIGPNRKIEQLTLSQKAGLLCAVSDLSREENR